LEIIIV
jgi:membrane protein implicated in regulation of membrane protease activity